MNQAKRTKTIQVNYMARVEGEGALFVAIEGDKVKDVKLKIFEPPRFFEALLRGRDFREAPDITARICGICPVAYQMSAVHAMEDALGVSVEGQLGELRRLLYCGEWIESHTLHIYMLHAPDFMGYPDAIRMARDFPAEVQRGLKLKKAGNRIVSLLGGREIHPINVKVGGFYRVPERSELLQLKEELEEAKEAAIATCHWAAGFTFPAFTRDYEFVAVAHPEKYPLDSGRIRSNKGIDIAVNQFHEHFEEIHVEHSTALQAAVRQRGAYLTGPLARYCLNFRNLSPLVKETAEAIGFPAVCTNPYQSIIVRSLEVLYAVDEALRVIAHYEKPERPAVAIEPKAGIGYGCTEAPRGLLHHRYEIGSDGRILAATIVPPTSQNQRAIEEDLGKFLEDKIDRDEKELTEISEQFIRNYDPCISCATHFLNLNVQRT